MIEDTLRPLTHAEREILRRLLTLHATGRDELVEQSKRVLARTLDKYGSFALEVPGVLKQVGARQKPYADAQTKDSDGVSVWVTLFSRDGALDEVEIVRADGLPLLAPISVSDLDVFCPPQSR